MTVVGRIWRSEWRWNPVKLLVGRALFLFGIRLARRGIRLYQYQYRVDGGPWKSARRP